MSGRPNNFVASTNEWNNAWRYADGMTNPDPTNRGVSLVSRSFSFQPGYEFGRSASGRTRPVVYEERNEPASLAGYYAPESPIPSYVYPEVIDARPRASIQESPSRFLTQLNPPILPQEHSKLTADEQQSALNRLKKTIHNPSPRRFTRRVSLYYRDHAKNTKDLNKQDDEDIKRCSVCLEDFEPKEEVMMTPCDHMFHEECIVPWAKSHGQCPVCRHTLFDQLPSNISGNSRNVRTSLTGDDLLIDEIASIVHAMEAVAFQWSRLNH